MYWMLEPIEIGPDDLGELLGITGRRVQQLETAGTVVAVRHGVYDLAKSVRGYCDFIRNSARGSATSKEQREEQIRLTSAKASIAELQHQELTGELIRADVVRRNGFKLGLILKNNLESIPDRQAAILAAESNREKVHDILAGEVADSLGNILQAMDQTEVEEADLDLTRIKTKAALDD